MIHLARPEHYFYFKISYYFIHIEVQTYSHVKIITTYWPGRMDQFFVRREIAKPFILSSLLL